MLPLLSGFFALMCLSQVELAQGLSSYKKTGTVPQIRLPPEPLRRLEDNSFEPIRILSLNLFVGSHLKNTQDMT